MQTFEFHISVLHNTDPALNADLPWWTEGRNAAWTATLMTPIPYGRIDSVSGATKEDVLQEMKRRIRAHFDNLKKRGLLAENLMVPIRID